MHNTVDISELLQIIGYQFRHLPLLELALTHPSYAGEDSGTTQHNQRLEYLGDAVLQLAVTCALYEKYPESGEGPLTKARAQLVNRRTLAEQSRKLNLGKFLLLSRGEEQSGGRERTSALTDVFEALVGAIFMDGGYDAASTFVLRQFRDVLGELEVLPNIENPKGELQEILQAKSRTAPVYSLISTTGPDHDRIFECVVQHSGEELGRGRGKSKKMAESQAAMDALQSLKKQNPPNSPTPTAKWPTAI